MCKDYINTNTIAPIGVDVIVSMYQDCKTAVFEFLQTDESNETFKLLLQINSVLSAVYNVPETGKEILIDYSQLSINVWGPLLWKLLHCLSILIQNAYYNGHIDTLLNFSEFIQNLDSILPCPECAFNYKKSKDTLPYKRVFKMLNFGFLVSGTHRFHNLISDHVAKQHGHVNAEFNDFHFVFQYGCYPRYKCNNFIETSVVRSPVKFYRPEHIKLALVLTLALEIDYFLASNIVSITCERIQQQDFTTDFRVALYNITETTADRDKLNNHTDTIACASQTANTITYALGYCKTHGVAPTSRYFNTIDVFTINAGLWIMALDFDINKEYRLKMNDNSIVVVRNNTIQKS